MSFFRGFSLNLGSTLAVFALGFVNTSLLADALGREQYGVLKLWTVIVLLGGLVLAEWLNKGDAYAVGRLGARDAAVDNTLLFSAAIGALLLLTAPLTLRLGTLVLPGLTLTQWLLGLGLIALAVLEKGQLGIFLGEERLRVYALLPLVFILVYVAGSLGLVGLDLLSLDRAMTAWLCGLVAAVLVGMVVLRRGGYRPGRGSRRVLAEMARIGGRGEVALVLIFLLFKSDVFLVNHFLGQEAVGVYGVATNFTDMMQRVPNVAAVILFAKVIRGQDSGRLTLQVAGWVLLFSLVCAAGLVLLGRPLLALFFPRYPDAYVPLVWLLPGMILAGCGSVFNSRLLGQGYPAVTLWAPALALGVNLGLNLWLIPTLGLRGAALSTSIAYSLWGVLVMGYCLRRSRLGPAEAVCLPWRRPTAPE
ncbi:MAG: polysaccharide biosynthesis C-terminal domain-containing protein [Candidatus Latescibacterota bacterium]|jgi:O-antigen/teichoic acid export membrane protein